MTPVAPVKLRLVRVGSPPGGARRLRLSTGAGLCALAVAILWAQVPPGRRAARSIPGELRSALYQRTLGDLKQSCGGRSSGVLEEHCRELASFLSQFDECRGECEALVRSQLAPNPTR